MTKEAKRYYREVKTLTPSKDKYEQSMLKNINMRIMELEDSEENLTYDDFCNIIGTPKDVIANYYETSDIDYLINRLRTTKITRMCAYFALVIIIMCSSIVAGYYYRAYIRSTSSIIEFEHPTIIVKEGDIYDEKN